MTVGKLRIDEGSLIQAINRLHEEDRVFYWRMVYQDKRFNAELVREINILINKEPVPSRGRGFRAVGERVTIYEWKRVHCPKDENDEEAVKVIRYKFPIGIDTTQVDKPLKRRDSR